VRGDDGRVYSADVAGARRHGAEMVRVGVRVALLVVEGARPHDVTAIVIGAGDAVTLAHALSQGGAGATSPPIAAAAPPTPEPAASAPAQAAAPTAPPAVAVAPPADAVAPPAAAPAPAATPAVAATPRPTPAAPPTPPVPPAPGPATSTTASKPSAPAPPAAPPAPAAPTTTVATPPPAAPPAVAAVAPSASVPTVVVTPPPPPTGPIPAATPAPTPPAAVTPPAPAPSAPGKATGPWGERKQWARVDGKVQSVEGAVLVLNSDNGTTVMVDISQLNPNVSQALRRGRLVSVYGYPLEQKFEAAGYIELDPSHPEPPRYRQGR
jgi:hypothetical protein